MSTNPRLNITIDNDANKLLISLAKQEKVPVATLARELLLEALEIHEDLLLSRLAEKREKNKNKLISHEKAWHQSN